ncbi:MAG TPA: hypothetical protein DD666_00730 [Advenella kashmirensis]|uniref:Uncharacterized protein n=1 Tax=Advenella kashmirensis TaxID=310575 RepID=A0A356LAH6_9BURK|nr:hypothetical protein [Advenella kashmirensis]
MLNENIQTSQQLRDAGMQTALSHADAVIDDWGIMAYAALEAFLESHPGETFMTEDVRQYAYQSLDLPRPPHERAWGGIANRAAKAGLIVRVRLAPVKTPGSHCANASIWRAA